MVAEGELGREKGEGGGKDNSPWGKTVLLMHGSHYLVNNFVWSHNCRPYDERDTESRRSGDNLAS